MGSPVVGCSCRVCRSRNPKDTRSRASLLVKKRNLSILIDTSTEFRLQAIREGITHLDAVFYTHSHADHLHGLDDIRPLTKDHPMPVYAGETTMSDIKKRFDYIFSTKPGHKGGGRPKIELLPMPSEGVTIQGLSIVPVPVFHGDMRIYGYRLGDLAYITDCSRIPEESYNVLKGVNKLIIGALRKRPHPTHFSIDEAIAEAKKTGAEYTWLTHLCHDHSHDELLEMLPNKIEPAYDGLCISV
ncbi:MBL fold metallo-hydrolase [Marispirochaeta sp.]|uniref:MBL fold metallo-hydrolase n=1 Tax=Marispirochaeta sp. TaxID=2038653 RepID=UPI0029C71217|nr:MBL fold metallo-hydrolase [Marispirochaeta sp.]